MTARTRPEDTYIYIYIYIYIYVRIETCIDEVCPYSI